MDIRNGIILASLFLSASFTYAESAGIEESRSKDLVSKSQALISGANKDWGLSVDEWSRYESIMSGPRGKWSKDLDPLTALGIEARTETERRRYAELLVLATRKRIEQELAFQLAYDAANERLFPSQLAVTQFLMKDAPSLSSASLAGSFATTAAQVKERVAFFTLIDSCSECDVELERLLGLKQVMDIYLVDSDFDDKKIRKWAVDRGLPVDRVKDRSITLNHNKYKSVTTSNKLPAIIRLGQ